MKQNKGLEDSLAEKTIYEELDIDGNPIFTKTNTSRGIEELKRKFNNEGQLIETFSEEYVGVYHHHKYYYDDEGKKNLEIWYDKDENVIYEWKLETDLDSLKIKEYVIEKTIDTILWSVTSLNEKLQPLNKSFFDRKGLQTLYSEFNKYGLEKRMTSLDKEGNIDVEYFLFYNKLREKIREVEIHHGGKRISEIEKLYNGGKVTKKTTKFRIDNGKSILTKKFDKRGNILSELKKSSNGKENYSIRFSYEFDPKENWIKKKEYRNDKLRIVTDRIIEYY